MSIIVDSWIQAVGSYRSVLSLDGVKHFFIASSVARLGVAMTAFSLIWTVNGATGSFASAGFVTGVFAIAEGIGGPHVARLVDRYGQGRVVPSMLVAHGVAMVGLIAAATLALPVAVLAVGAALAGIVIPQPGALSATRWKHAVPERRQLATAFALEAAVNDVVFLAGPTLVSLLGALVLPQAGSLCAVALVVSGCAVLLAQRSTEPPKAHRAPSRPQRLVGTPFVALVLVNLALGFYFGGMQLAVTSFTSDRGSEVLAGAILGANSAASLAAGLVYGSRTWRWDAPRVLLFASLYLLAGVVALALVDSVMLFALVVALLGCIIAPVLVITSVLLERTTPPGTLTQAFTWMNSASACGIAIAAFVVGISIEAKSAPGPFLTIAMLVSLMPIVAATVGRHLRRRG